MIHVIATIDLLGGRRDEFLSEFRKVVPDVLKEDGCLDYGPTVDVETNIPAQAAPRSSTVVIVERWENLECLEAHLIAPHMLAYREIVTPMIRDVTLHVLQPA